MLPQANWDKLIAGVHNAFWGGLILIAGFIALLAGARGAMGIAFGSEPIASLLWCLLAMSLLLSIQLGYFLILYTPTKSD